MPHKLIPYNKIKPNPFRHMDRYPISEKKIEDLIASMDHTGFWENIVGRERNSHVELAYGHHRWIAFGRKFGNDASMRIIIKDIPDEMMLCMMANENMQEYGTNAAIEQETIRAVVEAYAEGRIKLDRPKIIEGAGSHSIRFAPSFLREKVCLESLNKLKPYTAETIAKFLGWIHPGGQVSMRVRNALDALEAIEREIIEEEDLEGMTTEQARRTARQAKRIEKAHIDAGAAPDKAKEEARKATKKIASEVRKKGGKRNNNGASTKDIENIADDFLPPGASRTDNGTEEQAYEATEEWERVENAFCGFTAWALKKYGQQEESSSVDYAKMLASPEWNNGSTHGIIQVLDSTIKELVVLKQAMMDSLPDKQRKKLQKAGY